MFMIEPCGKPSAAVKNLKLPCAKRARPLLKPIQTLPTRSSPKERGKLSLSDGKPGEFARSCTLPVARSQRANPFVDEELVEIHTLPRESSKRRNTCRAA